MREGKNREVKRLAEHLGLTVNRLIRVSFGPFALGDLAEGAVEEVKPRVLVDQLGAKLAGEFGLDQRGQGPPGGAATMSAVMRIVAGKFRGAQLEAPKGLATRPTSDRVRQALFNVLEHGAPRFDFDGARVLDLFAGSGALGLEALSRGARYLSLHRGRRRGARSHPPQRRGARLDRRHQDLAARRDQARRGRHAAALRTHLLRSALRQRTSGNKRLPKRSTGVG